ncbi:hypothetical protein LTR43_011390 [Exophiala xenobiotica]|nr:hypothetical protein LTR55_011290 [Exophiala xenobiotica]
MTDGEKEKSTSKFKDCIRGRHGSFYMDQHEIIVVEESNLMICLPNAYASVVSEVVTISVVSGHIRRCMFLSLFKFESETGAVTSYTCLNGRKESIMDTDVCRTDYSTKDVSLSSIDCPFG